MEKILNTVLWILLIIFVGLAASQWYERNLVPVPFEQPSAHAAPLFKIGESVAHEESEWINAHFKTPIPAQGEPPKGWTPAEADLSPETCGACHPKQFSEWKDSWHANAMGPGMTGQFASWDGGQNDNMVKACQACHAPNTEQYERIGGEANPHYDEALRYRGVTCAGCHVREWTRYGPGNLNTGVEDPPHDGFVVKTEYKDSRFCESCHDFNRDQKSLNGKLLQETYAEWRHTKLATEGQTCQSCHMKDGAHTFKGVHDPEMVKSAFTAEAIVRRDGSSFMQPIEVEFSLTNVGAGHRFPSYTTPEVALIVEQLDSSGAAIEGTRQEGYVARRITPNLSEEVFDTRLLPGETFTMKYMASKASEVAQLKATVEVRPDMQYQRNYEIWLRNDTHPTGTEDLNKALAASKESVFVAWESTLELKATPYPEPE